MKLKRVSRVTFVISFAESVLQLLTAVGESQSVSKLVRC